MSKGFIRIPREILEDPRYRASRLKYQKVLIKLFEVVCYKETPHAIGTTKIILHPGQYCYSLNYFMRICNEDVKHEEDLINRDIVDHAMRYFENCNFVRREVRQRKSIVTILWNGFSESVATTSAIDVRQECDINKEEQEEQEGKKDCSVVLLARDGARKKSHTRKKNMTIHFQTNNLLMMKISQNEVYAHFLRKPYPPEIVQEAVRIISEKMCKTNDILRYAEGICKNLMKKVPKEAQKPIPVSEEKIIKINYKPLSEYTEFSKILEERKKEIQNAR